MRSGQYKLSSKGGGGEFGKGGGDISSGQFKTSYKELPPLTPFPQDAQQPMQTDFINLDSLHLSVLKRVDERDEGKEGAKKKYKEHIYKGNRKRDSILRHKSCENVSVLTRGTVTRVEQKVRSLLRVESKWSCEPVSSTLEDISPTLEDMSDDPCKTDFWQAGKIVTMTKKPRLVSAHSHSALHTLSTSSDNASCLSASSGYSSSSSSSSYGSFKSNESVCSSLTRHRNNSSGSQSPFTDNSRMLFVDNPLYDLVPSNSLQVTEPLYSLDSSHYESFPLDDFSFKEENILQTSRLISDPVAKECIEYFEKRISSSETLRKKWSLFICDPPERYNQINSDLISKGDAIIDSKFNAGFNSDMNLGVESNFILSEELIETKDRSNQKKNQLDEKMELLRREIASLILQDNTLFKQLLTLHESISNLKVQTAMNSTHGNNPSLSLGGSNPSALNASALVSTAGLHLGSTTPSDLESFTEEDEEDEEDEEEDEEDDEEDGEERGEEYEEQIQSFPQIDYYNNDDSLTQQNKTDLFLHTGAEEEESFPFCEDKPSATSNEDDEDDEGHGTDLSLGDTPSNSSSPASTLSSNSSEGISYSRNLYSEMTSDLSGSFTRCRKSYAPNARNRRRSSSVNRQSSSLECGTTTALVVIYADDEDLLLNASRPRSHSFSPLTTFAFHDALSYSSAGHDEGHKAGASPLSSFAFQDALGYTSLGADEGPKANGNSRAASDVHSLLQSHCQKNGKEVAENQSKVTLASCSTQPGNSSSAIFKSSNSNLSHPPYREALIM